MSTSSTSSTNPAVPLLQRLQRDAASPELRLAATSFLRIAESGEIAPSEFGRVVESSLQKFAGTDPALDRYMRAEGARRDLNESFGGLPEFLQLAKSTTLFTEDERFQYQVEQASEALAAGIPAYQVAESFLPGIKSYDWNQVLRGPLAQLQKRLGDTAQNRVIARAAASLETDPLWAPTAGRLMESLGSAPGAGRNAELRQILRSTIGIGVAAPALAPVAESIGVKAGEMARIRGDFSGKLRTSTRLAPALVTESAAIVLVGNRLLSMPTDGSKPQLLESRAVRALPQRFLEVCESYTQVKQDGSRLRASDGIYEYALVFENDQCQLEVDGRLQEGTAQAALENCLGLSPQVDVVRNLLSLAMQGLDFMAQLDTVVTAAPALPSNTTPTFDVFQSSGQTYASVQDPMTGTQELFEGKDTIAEIGESYGVQLLPLMEGDEVDPEAAAKQQEAEAARQEQLEKLGEKKDKLTEDLEEIKGNLDKIELLDEDYRSDDDVKRLYSELRERRDQTQQDLGRVQAQLLGSSEDQTSESAVDPEGTASSVLEQILELMKDHDVRQEFRSNSDIEVARRMGQPILLGSGPGSVLPIVEFEVGEDGAYRISEILLQFHDGLGSGPEEAEAALRKILPDGAGFELLEGGYLALGVQSEQVKAAAELEVPEKLESKLVNALDALTKGHGGSLEQAQEDGEQTEEEETENAE